MPAGKGFTRFRGAAGLEHVAALAQGENVQGRFLIFDTEPDMDRLVPPAPATPLPAAPPLTAIPQVVDRVFWYALGRAPSAGERELAEHALQDPAHPGRATADGLADFLWAVVLMSSGDKRPITSSLTNLQGTFFTDNNLISAASVLVALPTIIVFLALQRQFISGLTLGANKG